MKLGAFIRKERKRLGDSLAALGEKAGISATYIMDIEKGYIPSNKILGRLADALGVDRVSVFRLAEYERDPEAFELLHGTEGTVEWLGPEGPSARMVPVIDYTQAGQWREVVDAHVPGEGFEEVAVSTERADLIALRVKGNSMEPVIRNGQVIVVDPARESRSGDIVVVVKGQESTIKRLHRIAEDTVMLEPLNPAFERILLTKSQDRDVRIVGVVVEIKLIPFG
jgi:repressor LexA